MVALAGPRERRRLTKMGDGSEAFCRKALDAMRANQHIIPATVDLAEMARDLHSHDALNARLGRLMRLVEKVEDTDIARGSDVMVTALAGYQFLKIAGKGEGLDAVSRDIGKRFDQRSRTLEPEPVAQ